MSVEYELKYDTYAFSHLSLRSKVFFLSVAFYSVEIT
jgi:hypothetical protein